MRNTSSQPKDVEGFDVVWSAAMYRAGTCKGLSGCTRNVIRDDDDLRRLRRAEREHTTGNGDAVWVSASKAFSDPNHAGRALA